VCLTVSPYNFPLLIGLWSIPFALMTGNTIVWKPSERCPSAAILLANCFYQAGFPPSVFNVVHGGPSAVEKLLSQPAIKAVSFVGSDAAGERVHAHAIATRKRIQADLGSKNHGVIAEDASKERTLYAIAGSAFGAAGQRCMALSVVIFVGATSSWIQDLVRVSSSLKVGCGADPGVALGPLITSAAKQRVESIIQTAVEEGATLLLDGRGVEVPGCPKGNFVGPTIISNVQPYMECYQTEIFGPVLCCMQVDTFDEAVEIVNDNQCRQYDMLTSDHLAYWTDRWKRKHDFHSKSCFSTKVRGKSQCGTNRNQCSRSRLVFVKHMPLQKADFLKRLRDNY
jgi:malonate-semialdehyde dehydrogenase (acetylating)/methylmalonate-semialdehyde dehydrogenase